MASIALNRARIRSGPRPLNPRRDLKQVATLIEEAFGDELDAAGWAALRELQMAARLGPLLRVLTPADSRPSGIIDGYVWEEEGEVVGNVTLQRVPRFGSRFLIANVAVKKAWRGRGIASQLMLVAMDHIAREQGRWAILQVRESNDIARGMYQRMGFADVTIEHRLRIDALPLLPDAGPSFEGSLRPLTDNDWHAVRYLISRAVPSEARWWHPHRTAGFRAGSSPGWQRLLSRWLGVGHKMRWGLFMGEELMGVLDVEVLAFNEHRVDLLLHPDVRESHAQPLLHHALRYLGRQPARPISATLFDYQPQAIAALNALGFRPTITLVNMRKQI